jgi:hypothetical protein
LALRQDVAQVKRELLTGVLVAGVISGGVVFTGANTQSEAGVALIPSPHGTIGQTEANLTIEGGTVTDRVRMRLAILRFRDAGLELPSLQIVFRVSADEECHGALGYFSSSKDVWRISICSEIESVYEHELAHAWERANLTDDQRRRYTAFRSLSTWSEKGYAWNERGVEDAAFVIQQGLAGLPLPPALGVEARSRLEGYEMLTGQTAPQLVEWLAQNEVPCEERPTHLSRRTPDISGRVCEVVSHGRRIATSEASP